MGLDLMADPGTTEVTQADQRETFVCRFGVGDPHGLHSGVWRVWAGKRRADVYIAARGVAGLMKTSIHASGVRYSGLTSQYVASLKIEGQLPPGQSRHFDAWEGGRDLSSAVSLEYCIRFPTSGLRANDIRQEYDGKDVTWLPAAPPDRCVDVAVLLGPTCETQGWPRANAVRTELLKEGRLADGRRIWLVYFVTQFPRITNLPAMATTLRNKFSGDLRTRLNDEPGLRLLLGYEGDDGDHGCIDMAADTLLPLV